MTALAIVLLVLAITVCGLAGFAAFTARQVERADPPRGRFLELDGCRIHYVDQGAGPPLFLIHGLGGQLGNFTYALVGRLAKDFRVVAVDRPGTGYSTRPAGTDARLRAQGDVLTKVIRALKLDWRPWAAPRPLGPPCCCRKPPEASSGADKELRSESRPRVWFSLDHFLADGHVQLGGSRQIGAHKIHVVQLHAAVVAFGI